MAVVQQGKGLCFPNETVLFQKSIPTTMTLSSTLLLLSVQKSEVHSCISLLAHVNSLSCCHHDKSQVNLRKESRHRERSPPFKSLLHRKCLKMWSKAMLHNQKRYLPMCEIMIRMLWTGLTGPSLPTAASLLIAMKQQYGVKSESNFRNYIFWHFFWKSWSSPAISFKGSLPSSWKFLRQYYRFFQKRNAFTFSLKNIMNYMVVSCFLFRYPF